MKICLVDDTVSLNQALKISLEDRGHAVDCFNNSVEAEKHLLLNHVNYDVLILDWMMPGRTGLEICHTLRQNKIFTPILILTAVNGLHSKINALNSGADDYLTKPFLIPELLIRIQALIERPVRITI